MKVYLKITSFNSISFGAIHYYGQLETSNFAANEIVLEHKLTAKECAHLNKNSGFRSKLGYYRQGDFSYRFESLDKLREIAVKVFNEKLPHNNILVVGSRVCAKPMEVIAGLDKEKMAKLNALHEKCKLLGWWDEGNSVKVGDLVTKWDNLLEDFLNE